MQLKISNANGQKLDMFLPNEKERLQKEFRAAINSHFENFKLMLKSSNLILLKKDYLIR